MAKFHFNPETGKTGLCEVTPGSGRTCPHGGPSIHYTTEAGAQRAYEETMRGSTLVSVKTDGRSNRNQWANMELYRELIGDEDEVFVHPQGKVAIYSASSGSLRVFREGKKSSTSGTIDQLRAGRGAWKIFKEKHVSLNDAYNSAGENSSRANSASVSPRESANIAAGYPADSQLDASRSDEIEFSTWEPEYSWKNDRAWGGSAILTVRERANPHKSMRTSEWLTGWNDTDKDGKVIPATFEVWEQRTGGTPKYKLVTTSGNPTKLGATNNFYADQTGANFPGKWTCIGAFKSEEGGAAVGVIPNRAMPMYTYK